MTRREFLTIALPVGLAASTSPVPLIVPIQHVIDGHAHWQPDQLQRFWASIWPETVRDFASCGIRLESRMKTGEVRRSPGGRPIFTGLDRGVINFIVTDQIPLAWDYGRGVSGVTTRYEGYHVCVIALNNAHGHQVPLLSVNTCVHELLHALLEDIFERRPQGFQGQAREFRVDWYATRLWLFHDGAAIRVAAREYLTKLAASGAGR